MKFAPLKLKFDAETGRGTFEAIELLSDEPVGETLINVTLSDDASAAIKKILCAEIARVTSEISSAAA